MYRQRILHKLSSESNPIPLYFLLTGTKVAVSESLMTMVAEVEQQILVGDFPARNEETRTEAGIYRAHRIKAREALAQLRREINDAVTDLEAEYYSCRA
jgi:ribosome recycling factor